MTGYLHDVVEDTDTSIEDLRKLFAVDVCEGVMALTKDKRLTKAEQMQDSLRRIRQASNEIAIVKIADRIANLSNPQLCWSCDKQLYYFQESIYLHKMLAYANKKIADKLAVSIQAYEIRIREAITIKVHYPTLR
jgi:guanosine-3',5'-bis(diphosphate) 3'-pyrophosphohydrolase